VKKGCFRKPYIYSSRSKRKNEEMAQVVWTEPALSDLDAIAEYIALDKPSAAVNLVNKVFSSKDRLEQFPESGRKPPEFKKSRY